MDNTIEHLQAREKILVEVIERADYYINRLEAAWRGQVVRDLDEAQNAYVNYRAKVAFY